MAQVVLNSNCANTFDRVEYMLILIGGQDLNARDF